MKFRLTIALAILAGVGVGAYAGLNVARVIGGRIDGKIDGKLEIVAKRYADERTTQEKRIDALEKELAARPIAKDMSEEVAALTERIGVLEKQLAHLKSDLASDAKKIEEGFGATARGQAKLFMFVRDRIRRVGALERKARGRDTFVERVGR